MFVDSHAHLEMEQFNADRQSVLERARAAGVENIVAIGSGTGPGSLACGVELAEKYDWVYATIGIHPHEAKLATDADFAELATLAKNPRVIAWGEIGLDYFYDHSPRDVQQQVFVRQMELAGQARLPIVIHCRPSANSNDAWQDCLALLRQHWGKTALGGVLHCFTGIIEHARAALDLGFVISFAGNVTFPKAENIREAAREVPLDRMFIETDSPFLAPVPHRGKRNEPAFVVDVARKIAELRGLSPEQIGEQTSRNFFDFFKLQNSNSSKSV
ncbi:MAG TPA: TatD family hydrolase [Terriglobales bacterium]|nr:TatD family hydrolase [Terriglobales bacterium]